MTGPHEQPRLLIVDDEAESHARLTKILKNLSCVFDTAKNGRDAVLKAIEFPPDIIFLDVMMPLMDGFEVCKVLKDNPDLQHIPIIMLTALDDEAVKLRALEAGVNEFLTKPFDASEVLIRTRNLLRLKEYEDFLKDHTHCLHKEFKQQSTILKTTLQESIESQKNLKASYLDTIYRLTVMSEFKDEATVWHVKRVGLYCAHIAKQLGWPAEQVERIQYAAPMHDIGKIGIPSDILRKPTGLTREEFALVKTHTTVGAKILQGSQSAFLQMAEQIALSHHERWDGSGYPAGLKGEDAPLEARITAFADQYDALRSPRPYKPPFDYVMTYRIMVHGNERIRSVHFDPQLLEIFKDTAKTFEDIYEMNKETDVPYSLA